MSYEFEFASLPKKFDIDCLLGMNNLRYYAPYNTHYFYFDNIQIPRVHFLVHLLPYFTPASRGESTQLIDHHTVTPIYTYPVHITSDLELVIHNILEHLYTNNRLLYFDKAPRYCSLDLLEQYKETKVTVNSIIVSPLDKQKCLLIK